MAALLAGRGVQLELVIDEGGLIFKDGLPPFSTHPTAIVGTLEKVRRHFVLLIPKLSLSLLTNS